jgi:putative membrane protein
MEFIEMKYVVGSLIYTGIGIAMFIISFVIFDILTPKVSIWKELVEKQNIALAIFICGVVLGISIIIGSSIHG